MNKILTKEIYDYIMKIIKFDVNTHLGGVELEDILHTWFNGQNHYLHDFDEGENNDDGVWYDNKSLKYDVINRKCSQFQFIDWVIEEINRNLIKLIEERSKLK